MPKANNAGDGQVGQRIRLARMSRGLSQAALASALHVSASYLSLIESGRRPPGRALLARIAEETGVSEKRLREGSNAPAAPLGQDDLDLKFAEAALRNGELELARERYAGILSGSVEGRSWAYLFEARLGLATALESLGRLVEAADLLERLSKDARSSLSTSDSASGRLSVALCRVYRECGDLTRAIDVGEEALAAIPTASGEDPATLEAEVQLISTLAGCYYERGDLTRAHLLARSAVERSDAPEALPTARAAAYWNAAQIAAARGDIAGAHQFVDRARVIYAESEHQRAIVLLRLAAGSLSLQDQDANLDEAENLIRVALRELPRVGTQADIAYGEVELARCRMLAGDPETAVSLAEQALGRLPGGTHLQAARARLALGQALLMTGDRDGATEMFATAEADLRDLGGDRQAAAAWRELAEVLSDLGRPLDALDAYRQAADAAGVSVPAAIPASLRPGPWRP